MWPLHVGLSEFSSGLWQAHSCKSHRQILQRAPWQAGPSLTSPPAFLDLEWHFKWNNHGTSWKEAIFVRWHLYPLSVRQQRAVGELLGCRWSVWCVGEKDAVLTNVTSLTRSDAGCASPLCLWVPSLYQIPPISTAKSCELEMKDLQMTAADASDFTVSTQPATAVRCTLDCTPQVPFSFGVHLHVTGALLVFPSWFLYIFLNWKSLLLLFVLKVSAGCLCHTLTRANSACRQLVEQFA